MFNTKITRLLKIEYPIIQGALQWISKAELAAAVSNAGGLGTINVMSYEDNKHFEKELKRLKSMTDNPFMVNISILPGMKLDGRISEILDIIIDEKVGIVETSGNSPELLLPKLKNNGVFCIHKVPAIRFAKKVEKIGIDAVTIVGYECGGHPGMDNVTSLILWAKAVDELSIPVIGGGGVSDGRTFLAAMALGLDGVIIGTRFVASHEAPVHDNIKRLILNMEETDTVLAQNSIRNALRVFNSDYAKEVISFEKSKPSFNELYPYIAGKRSNKAYQDGDYSAALIPLGQCSGRIKSINSVEEIISEIVKDSKKLLENLNTVMR